jgi:hypothetical protein
MYRLAEEPNWTTDESPASARRMARIKILLILSIHCLTNYFVIREVALSEQEALRNRGAPQVFQRSSA